MTQIETQNFFNHKIDVLNIEEPRFEYFKKICLNKKVLHIGCADAMFYNKDYNLHAALHQSCKELHGLDTDKEALEVLRKDVPGKYFNNISEIYQRYDIILLPEVIEHIDNLSLFLNNIYTLDFKELYITAPNIMHYVTEMKYEEGCFYEVVHPDHKYWFSPYTLYKNLSRYNYKTELFFIENKSMIGAKVTR